MFSICVLCFQLSALYFRYVCCVLPVCCVFGVRIMFSASVLCFRCVYCFFDVCIVFSAKCVVFSIYVLCFCCVCYVLGVCIQVLHLWATVIFSLNFIIRFGSPYFCRDNRYIDSNLPTR